MIEEKSVNWSNCPFFETCMDDKKAIMTYCDTCCSDPRKHEDLLTPKGDDEGLLTKESREDCIPSDAELDAYLATPDDESATKLRTELDVDDFRRLAKIILYIENIEKAQRDLTSRLRDKEEQLATEIAGQQGYEAGLETGRQEKDTDSDMRAGASYALGYNTALAGIPERERLDRPIVCPFCGQDDFDQIGLKHHLSNHCEVYQNVEEVNGWT